MRTRRSGGDAGQGRSSSRRSSSSTSSSQQPAAESSNPIAGWFRGIGQSISDGWDQTTEAVGSAVDSVRDGAQELWSDVSTAVQEGAELVQSSDLDVDWGQRRVTLSTDLDEAADLYPPLRQWVQADQDAADNRVQIVCDGRNNTITITSDELALNHLSMGAHQTGASQLTDVRIVLTDPEFHWTDALGGLDELSDSFTAQVWVGEWQSMPQSSMARLWSAQISQVSLQQSAAQTRAGKARLAWRVRL